MKINSQSVDYRIAMVAAQWHGDHVNAATTSCYSELVRLGVGAEKNIELFKVPGSLEIPLVSKLVARTGDWDAVIAFGFVTDGGIYRHEFVAQAVLNGLVSVALETDVPILSVVLTPQAKFDEKDARQTEFFLQHLIGKGAEAGRAAVQAIEAVRPLLRRRLV